MSDIQYFTEEGLQKLKDELEHLKSIERPKVIQQIAEARDKGDLSENAEYDAAKEAQGHLEDRINKLEAIYSNARVVDTSKLDVSVVRLLTKVTIKNTSNGMEMIYSIVPEAEAQTSAYRAERPCVGKAWRRRGPSPGEGVAMAVSVSKV